MNDTKQNDAKRIVLTGASRGLGRAMTAGFIHAGHHVYGCSRSPDTADSLKSCFTSQGTFTALDVRDDQAVGDWAESVLAAAGPPDLLINNAALMNQPRELWKIDPAEFRDLMDVNVDGIFHVIRHFVPAMIERSSGVIVNFSSEWGRTASPQVGPYCASKWAVEGLSQALAQELPRGMASIALNPGIIDTDMLRSCWGDAAESYPSASAWAEQAVPYILGLNSSHNGQSLSVS